MIDGCRFVLGTVQLGLPYGVANSVGQPDQAEANRIISAAWQGGVREFDTAQGYGASESVLGLALRECGLLDSALVTSKLLPSLAVVDSETIEGEAINSLERLGVKKLHGLMLHREQQLDLWSEGLGHSMMNLKMKGYVDWCGVSVYSPEAAQVALETDGVDVIQLPTNILDRRFEEAGVFSKAESLGKTIYIRSVFLQGLLLMNPETAEAKVKGSGAPLAALRDVAHTSGLPLNVLCMGAMARRYPRSRVLFGAETVGQVADNIASWSVPVSDRVMKQIESIRSDDAAVLDPSRWEGE